jgi:hypothetical protein
MIQPVFASTYHDTLLAQAHEKGLANHPYWHRLLHDRRNLLGVYQSEIDDPSFFLSPRGRRDPSAELDATLDGFFKGATGGADSQPAPCRYPARYSWLKDQLGIDPSRLPTVDCSRYEKWRSQIDPESAALVFASSYMNNPSSMYGHTLLLLHKKGHPDQELLDYVVNFAADLEADNGFLYAMKGLLGGYHGRFSTFPYYMKVQEYNNLESRDLWEYDLHLSSASLERMVEHLWELGNVRIRYFFFNKNCSYYLMPLLEVAEPDRDFKSGFVFKTIPVDTVKVVLHQPGLVGKISRRPSHASKMFAERTRLTTSEVRLAAALADHPETPVDIPADRAPLILDTAYDLFRYHYGFIREQPKAVQAKEQKLLLLRNQAGMEKSPPASRGENSEGRPDLAHASGRIGLSYGFTNHSHFEELSLRPAIHDQDDPPAGYLPGSKLEMFDLRLRFDNDRKTGYVQDFSLADILSLTPWDSWIHPPSWKVNTGWRTANELNRDPENSQYYGLNLGSGYAANLSTLFPSHPVDNRVMAYAMAEIDLGVGHSFDHSVRIGGGPCGGILVSPWDFWRTRFQVSYTPYAIGGTPAAAKLGLFQSVSLTKTLSMLLKLERDNQYKEFTFGFLLYL